MGSDGNGLDREYRTSPAALSDGDAEKRALHGEKLDVLSAKGLG